jgi:hypothetical protein
MFMPVAIPAQQGVGIVIILLVFAVSLVFCRRSSLFRPLRLLLSRFPDQAGYSRVPTMEQERHRGLRGRIEENVKEYWPAIPSFVVFGQPCVSIWLYSRRLQHSPKAVTLADRKIFELALGAVLLDLLALGVMFKLSCFLTTRGELHNDESILHHVILFIGNRSGNFESRVIGISLLAKTLYKFAAVSGLTGVVTITLRLPEIWSYFHNVDIESWLFSDLLRDVFEFRTLRPCR